MITASFPFISCQPAGFRLVLLALLAFHFSAVPSGAKVSVAGGLSAVALAKAEASGPVAGAHLDTGITGGARFGVRHVVSAGGGRGAAAGLGRPSSVLRFPGHSCRPGAFPGPCTRTQASQRAGDALQCDCKGIPREVFAP